MTSRKARARIAVDAMGGDIGPEVNIVGSLEALAADADLEIILVGQSPVIEQTLKQKGGSLSDRLRIVHCTEVVSMEDHAASVIRKKRDSSINVGLELVKEGKADAFISAGNSGAVMAGAMILLGRLNNVERPAIIVKLPTAERFVILLDVGANVDCKPEHLVCFAEMGKIYAETVEGIASPRIATLSNGSEAHKGNELTRETDTLLKQKKDWNYLGYIEGNDLFRGQADVIVCDGFVGNIALKLSEGLAETTFKWFRKELQKDWLGLLGVVLLRRLLKNFRRKFDYQPYGAAPLLGIQGMVLISHGASTEKAIRNGILTAKKAVDQGFIEKIGRQLQIEVKGPS